MDNKTYEALKRLVGYAKTFHASNVNDDIEQVENWIEETEKEHD